MRWAGREPFPIKTAAAPMMKVGWMISVQRTGDGMISRGMMRILCYGDSNTYGWDPRDFLGIPYARPWPTVLVERMNADVISMGEPGREIPGERETKYLLATLETEQPNILMILLGTNDLLNHPARPVEQIAQRMEALVTAVMTDFPEIKLILMSPPRMSDVLSVRNTEVQCLADAYRQIVARCDASRTLFFDTAALNLPLAFDGIHLTEEGHKILGEAISLYV